MIKLQCVIKDPVTDVFTKGELYEVKNHAFRTIKVKGKPDELSKTSGQMEIVTDIRGGKAKRREFDIIEHDMGINGTAVKSGDYLFVIINGWVTSSV